MLDADKKKLRAAVYNRCSTEEESQKDALEKQIEESLACVGDNGWKLTDTYIEAKSGTSTKGRCQYNRLYADLLTDKFDIVVIKSQDRLMRNVKDWYLFIERLVSNNKRLYMYIEHKFYTPDDALITGIRAILAEDYSRELSKKINNAHYHRQRAGTSFVLNSNTFGYNKNPDGTITINPQEAEMIQLMFELCASGYGSRSISNILDRKGYRNRTGKRFQEASIRRIIRNKLAMGTVVMNRRHFDFESKKTLKTPENQWIEIKNALPPIISEELWNRANKAMDARACAGNKGKQYMRGSNPGKYQLSKKMFCGLCGAPYYRVSRPQKLGIDWKCSSYIAHGRKTKLTVRQNRRKLEHSSCVGCDNIHLEEDKLFRLLENVSETYYHGIQIDQESVINRTVDILRKVLSEYTSADTIETQKSNRTRLLKQKDILIDKLLNGIISDEDYKRKTEELDGKIRIITADMEHLLEEEKQMQGMEARIDEIRRNLQESGLKRASAYEMIENIDSIMVYPEELIINFSASRLLGLMVPGQVIDECDSFESPFSLKVSIVDMFRKDLILAQMRDTVVQYMEEEPQITAKVIAQRMNISLSTTNKRITELKNAGRIQYIGAGGHGCWEIVNQIKE